jgi:diguanylate cyclase (GGDEF)-like protein
MSDLTSSSATFFCAGLALINVLALYFWQRMSARRYQEWNARLRSESLQRGSILELSRSLFARKFELDWLVCLQTPSTAMPRILTLLEQSLPAQEVVFFLSTAESAEPAISAWRRAADVPVFRTPGIWQAAQSHPVCLQRHRDFDYAGERDADSAPGQLWGFPCGAEAPASGMLFVSRVPELTGDARQDQELFASLCRSVNLPRSTASAVSVPLSRQESEELSLVRDMLELRTLTDRTFASPCELLEQFLTRLAHLTGFDRCSIYEATADAGDGFRQHATGGAAVHPALFHTWNRAEQALFETGSVPVSPVWSDRMAASGAPLPDPIQTAFRVPLSSPGFRRGILLLSAASPVRPHAVVQELATWAGQFLSQTVGRVQDYVQLEQRARRDGLTQLANRQTFDAEIQKHLRQCVSIQAPCSLILLDIDHFKAINDTCGHAGGDDVLRQLAQRLNDCVQGGRVTDRPVIARYGGEEFAVLLPEVPITAAQRIAEQVRQAVEAASFSADGHILNVTVSMGVSCRAGGEEQAAHLVREADQALYAAKRQGRNQVQIAGRTNGPARRAWPLPA